MTQMYVIVWGDEWTFQTVPADTVKVRPGDTLYVSKDAALNAAINQMQQAHRVLNDAIRRAVKKQRKRDHHRDIRDAASQARMATLQQKTAAP